MRPTRRAGGRAGSTDPKPRSTPARTARAPSALTPTTRA